MWGARVTALPCNAVLWRWCQKIQTVYIVTSKTIPWQTARLFHSSLGQISSRQIMQLLAGQTHRGISWSGGFGFAGTSVWTGLFVFHPDLSRNSDPLINRFGPGSKSAESLHHSCCTRHHPSYTLVCKVDDDKTKWKLVQYCRHTY